MSELIKIEDIKLTKSPKVRDHTDDDVVSEYALAYKCKDKLPYPMLYRTPDGLLVADGLHRIKALIENGAKVLNADVRQGTVEDCFVHAAQANLRHGLRRSNADKRAAVATALSLFTGDSDRKIAEWSSVSHDLVAAVRKELESAKAIKESDVRTGKDSKQYKSSKPDQVAIPPTEISKPQQNEHKVPKPTVVPAKAKKEEEVIRDGTGFPIPEKALVYWNRRGEASGWVRIVRDMRLSLSKVDADDPLWFEVKMDAVLLELQSLESRLKRAIPHAVCAVCQGKLPEKCARCGGRGMISEHTWDKGVSPEFKKVREKIANAS